MPALPIADKATVDTINTNVGSNADTSSATGSVHAKLKDLKAALGAINDAANAAGSANAKLAETLARIGATNDAANALGSVNAKLRDIKASTGNSIPFRTGTRASSLGTTNAKTQTHLDITGSGYLMTLTSSGNMSADIYSVQIDGGPILAVHSPAGTAFLGWRFNSRLIVRANNAPSEALWASALLD